MAEPVKFSVDSSVSPVRVLVGQSDDQGSYLGVDGWPASRFVRWLCPVSDDSSAMPAQHRFGFHDHKRVASTGPSHRRPKEGEDRAVDVSELWSVDLTLKDEELVAQCEDLCVAGVAGGEYPYESVENKANQSGKEGHERRMLPASAMAKTR